MDPTTTTSKRARDDSELECELTPVSMTYEPTQSGEPHHHQPQSERDDSPNGGKQDSTGDGAQQPPRKKNRRDKQQQRQARQDNYNHHQACTYCLGTGNPERASEHSLAECHWKLASDAMNAYELAEGIHKQKHEAELAALKARHDAQIKTLKEQHDAQVQNLNARVTNLQDKNEDMADRIKILTDENVFLTAQNDYVHDDIDRMAEEHAKTLDGLAAQRDQEVAVLTGQYEKEIDDQENSIKRMEKEALRLVEANHQLRLTLTQSHEKEVRKLCQVIEDLEAAQDENELTAQHQREIKALENRHKNDTERITAKLEAEHEYKIKQLQETQQAELWTAEHRFEDRIDLIRYESEVKNHHLQQELADVKGAWMKLRGELAEAREKAQSLAKEKKAALEKPKLDGYLQHVVEKLKKEVKKHEVIAAEFKEDRELYQRKIRELEEELASMRSARRALECALRNMGVTEEEIKANVGGTAMRRDLDAESSDESGVFAVTDSEFEQSTDSDSNSDSDSDSELDEDTDVEMREGDTDVDEEEEDEEDEEEQEEKALDSVNGYLSDVVSESTELDEDEEEVEKKSVQDGEERRSSHHEAAPGNGEDSSSNSEESDLLEVLEEEDVSPPPLVTGALPVTPVSQPYNPAAPIIPIPPNHMPITIGEGARQMTYVRDPYSFLSGGYWVETVNMNATPIPQQQQQQQRSTNPTPARSVRKGQEDDDESTTLDLEEEQEADDDDDDDDEVKTVWEHANS